MTGEIVCERPASELPVIGCDLYPLDKYNLVIVQPDFQTWICSVETLSPSTPTEIEIKEQCPLGTFDRYLAGSIVIKPGGTRTITLSNPTPVCSMPPVETGPYLLQTPVNYNGLVTHEPLALLAGRLLWVGLSSPDCHTWSGIDPVTGGATPCGINSSWPELLRWQNQFNESIWNAAVSVGVPAGLLKRMIMVESQFWPLWSPPNGERGLLQLTPPGADTVLQYSQVLSSYYCPFAIDPNHCGSWGLLTPGEKIMVEAIMMNDLACINCSPAMAARHGIETMPVNAEIMKAYYCHAASVTGTPSWENMLIDFNAGQSCLITHCQAGVDYVAEVMR